MKVKVIREFIDLENDLKRRRKINHEYEVSNVRGKFLIEKGFVEEIKDKKTVSRKE